MTPERFSPSSDPGEVSRYLQEYGFAIVDDLADQTLLDQLAQQAQPYIDASATGRDVYDGQFTRRTGALIARCPAARQLVMDPLVVATVREFLHQATTVQLHLTQIISIEPGESAQKHHRDQMAFDFYPFPPDYHVQCNTMWALTDFTIENGATHIRPGTSGLSDEASESVPAIQAEMRRGGVLFYDGKVLHGGGANVSSETRRGVNITYAVGWVRQEENQFLACPVEIAKTLDDELLKMMGYQQGAFALGYVGDQQDPLAALRGTDEKARLVSEFAESGEAFKKFTQDFVQDLDGEPNTPSD
ncbi:MAG: phytanoyl-CoA dioxygenase family protein [Acidimicrobiales bacterium]